MILALTEARSITKKPIIGDRSICFSYGSFASWKILCFNYLEISVPVIKQNIEAQGFGNLCKDIIASGIPVLELENNPVGAINTLSECIKIIEVHDPKVAVILGCAGMTKVCERLQAR